MTRWVPCALVLLPACFHPNYDHPVCGQHRECPSGFTCSAALVCESGSSPNLPDASTGSPSDACTSFATLLNTCQLSFDADLIVNAAASYDTDSHVLMIGGTAKSFALKTVMIGPDQVDVISAHDVHLGTSTRLRATGSHGLVIIANHDFLIDEDAQIDVSNGGAGARAACPNGATRGQNNANGAGGGGGGGFGDDGGNGGNGNHDGAPGQGGSRGRAEPSFPVGLHGGCPGADGGTGDAPGGVGGKGGGALYVVAARQMVFTSVAPLSAGGSGGAGGNRSGNNGDAGGGGGGSGGLLIVEAPHILASVATIAANGGAGGEGSDSTGVGVSGAAAALSTDRAAGGSGGSTTGSDGGDGGSAVGTAGLSVTDNADGGGGGGGGGAGFIRLRSADAVFQAISPSPL